MTFSEKLNYLLELSGASNAELARASGIDPSQVSRLRGGTRNIPKRIHTIELMSEFFAGLCIGDYQRSSLADTIGDKKLLTDRSAHYTADVLCSWLRSKQSDSSARLDHFMRSFEDYDRSVRTSNALTGNEHPLHVVTTYGYEGNEGRRTAVADVINYLVNSDTPGEVYILSDENLHWLAQDKGFSDSLIESMVKLAEKGFTVKRIVSPLRDSVSAIEALDRWMPIYMTGALTSFHYPRMRDGLFRRFMIVSPGNFTLSSCALGDQHECASTYVSYEPAVIEDDTRFFNSYLSKCAPLAEPYIYERDPVTFSGHLLDFHSISSDGISKWMGMTCNVVPPSIINRLEQNYTDPDSMKIISVFRSIQEAFEKNLDDGNRFIEIIRLFSAEQVLRGEAQLTPSLLLPDSSRCYTVEEYRQHLAYILSMMEKHPNYYVLVDVGDMTENELHLKDGKLALLVRTTTPFTIFSTSEHSTLSAVQEYLMLQATRYGSSMVIQRRHTMEKLQNLINHLS
ncbi:MAG: helix-turn-helix transcriptional regulator [Ruminococcaceae bacterium]|nr:helix-turn-helix transcriptional regulator [Oscillospiraceae bacterium]